MDIDKIKSLYGNYEKTKDDLCLLATGFWDKYIKHFDHMEINEIRLDSSAGKFQIIFNRHLTYQELMDASPQDETQKISLIVINENGSKGENIFVELFEYFGFKKKLKQPTSTEDCNKASVLIKKISLVIDTLEPLRVDNGILYMGDAVSC